jgi:O-antigen/teichoic acid export membrane protein
MYTISSQIGIFMVSQYMTADAVANYGVSLRYYYLILMLLPAIKTVLPIRLARADMIDDIAKQEMFIKKWMLWSGFAAVPCALTLVFLSAPVMNALNGPGYSSAIVPFRILAISAMLTYIFSANTDLFRAMNKFVLLFCFGFLALVVNFLSNYFLIPLYGTYGAAVSSLISFSIVSGLTTSYV